MKKFLLAVSAFILSFVAFAADPEAGYISVYDFTQTLDFVKDTSIAVEGSNDAGYMYVAPGTVDGTTAGPKNFQEAGFFKFRQIGQARFAVKNSTPTKECLKYNITGKSGILADGGDILFRIEDLSEGEVFAIKYTRKGTSQTDFYSSKRESAVKWWDIRDTTYDDPSTDYEYLNTIDPSIDYREPTSNSDTVINYYKVNHNIKYNPFADLYITNAIIYAVYFYEASSDVSKNFIASASDAERQVVKTYYLNVAGLRSDSPFPGFNIKVDVLDDKSTRAQKVFIMNK